MKSINFNTGVKQYAINGDENNAVSVNINDVNLPKRIGECQAELDAIQAEFKAIGTPTVEQMAEYDERIKKMLDYAFNTDISERVFGSMNCLSPTEDNEILCVGFLNAFLPLVMEDIKKFSKNLKPGVSKKVEAYTTFDEPIPKKKQAVSLASLNDKQIAYLQSLA
ncbi:MAG: hypothetical protein NC122_07070 [Faecalibacterium sp.]|nr:hypothetical protein [Ruminococcus sp.]MCM1392260.1 hypothetical protein [Ruminococcus sp.]MCM1485952.1 hypothetical protein [Faecalibacterium sp.]